VFRAILTCALLALAAACNGAGDGTPAPTTTPPTSPAVTATAAAITNPTNTAEMPAVLEVAPVTNVVDGDTIDVLINGKEMRVRYIGIDTPETVDPRRPVGCFGREASERNRRLVEGKSVGLERDVSETDQYERLLRYVWVDGQMVNETLVEEGYAKAVTYPPDVKYADLFASLQGQAREAGRGLWSACATPEPPPTENGACAFSGSDEPVIKGNISLRTGEKIYHVPGGEYYDQTVIDEAKGERWFCTEAEAIAAGWRKSKS
jgi:micrococcal nuclease